MYIYIYIYIYIYLYIFIYTYKILSIYFKNLIKITRLVNGPR